MKHSFLLQCIGLIRIIMDVKIRLPKCPRPKIMAFRKGSGKGDGDVLFCAESLSRVQLFASP